MTNKQIIIDSVDVSGCEFLRNCIIPDNYGCKIDDSLCCDVGNCYYKQFKRKEQECQQIMDNYTELDLQRIKECKNLQAEIDDLKEWKKTVVDMFNRTCKCKYLNQEAALCELSGKQCVAINECMYKKHQALVVIKKYCEDQNLKADFTACEILQIISEVLDEKEMGNNTSNKTTSIQS